MFQIEFTLEALEDLRRLRKFDQIRIMRVIEEQLAHQATQRSRNRKRLRTSRLSEWELRVDNFRVFYDVDVEQAVVKVEAVGYKEGNTLFLRGEEYDL